MSLVRGLTVSLTLLLVFAFAPRAADIGSCGDLPCRSNGLAYVSEAGGIVIMPGEAFSIELKIEGDKVLGVTPRRLQPDLANSVELDFLRSSGGPMLKLTSHLSATIKADGYLRLADGRFVRTSLCPIVKSLPGYESWSDSIEFLELRNFRVMTDNGAMVCN